MAKPTQGFFKFNAGKKYKFRGPHPASKESKEHTKLIDAYIANLPQNRKVELPTTPQPVVGDSEDEAAKKAEARKKYLEELKSWRDD